MINKLIIIIRSKFRDKNKMMANEWYVDRISKCEICPYNSKNVKNRKNITKIPILIGSSIFKNSYKVGIELEKNKNTKEKHLYRLDQIEMNSFEKKWSFIVEFKIQGKQLKDNEGYLKLGGEGKICKYKWCCILRLELFRFLSIEFLRCKIYFQR